MLYNDYREPLEDAAAKWFEESTKAAVNPKAKYILADHTECLPSRINSVNSVRRRNCVLLRFMRMPLD